MLKNSQTHTPKKKKKRLTAKKSVKLQDTKWIYTNWFFLYNANAESKNKINKTIHFTIGSKRIKSLGINVQEFYNEKSKILFKYTKKI